MTLSRVRSLIVIGVLAVLAITTVSWAIAQDGQAGAAESRCLPKISGTPPKTKSVKLVVLNATSEEGLARKVAADLRKAGFNVVKTGNEARVVESSAQVRYGPKGLTAAALVRAYVRGSDTIQDDSRKDATVDLILGDEYLDTGITPPGEVQRVLDELGPLEEETDLEC